MMLRALFVSVAALAVLPITAALAEFSEPVPIGAGEVLIQYETTKPTDAQIQICEKIGGEITQLADGTYVCVRRST
jgi:hypothetical protein